MSALVLLIGFSLFIACCFLGAFIWATHNGQFDDAITPSMRILHNEDEDTIETKTETHEGSHE